MRYLGYVAFFIVSFVLSLYLSFPWGAVKQRALQGLSELAGTQITAKTLEPSWLTGFEATGVELQTSGDPVKLDSLFGRAHVLDFLTGGFGGRVEAPVGGGALEADVSGTKEQVQIELTAEAIEVALVPAIRELTGLALGGELALDVELDLGIKDPKLSNGQIRLRASDLETLPGSEAKFPVPELVVGSLDWNLPVENGKLIIRNQRLDGPNVNAEFDGEVVLAQPLERSLVNLLIKFKPTDVFLKKEPLLAQLIKNLNNYRSSDGYYGYQISGTVKRPRPMPKRP